MRTTRYECTSTDGTYAYLEKDEDGVSINIEDDDTIKVVYLTEEQLKAFINEAAILAYVVE